MIVGDIDVLIIGYPHIAVGTEFSLFKNVIIQVEEKYIKPIVPTTDYQIWEGLKDLSSPSAIQILTLNMLAQPIAHFAVAEYLKLQNSMLGNAGARVAWMPDNRPLNKEELGKLINHVERTAWSCFDNLITWLEANKNDISMATWFASDQYKLLRKPWLYKLTTFNEFVKIEGRRTLQSLYNNMLLAQRNDIKNEIGEELYDELLPALTGERGTSEDEKPVVDLIKEAVAYKTIAYTAGERILKDTYDGISIMGFGEEKTKEDLESTHNYLSAYSSKSASSFKRLRDYLNTNASSFPTYAASSKYIDPSGTDTRQFENSSSNKTFLAR